MRIKSIALAWFRGAADPVSLEANCKSMVVYGLNGSGKSSFVDAVEYVLKNGRIEHLRHEYSSSYQANAIHNTHKPESSQTTLGIRFGDDSEIRMAFSPNGAPKKTGAKHISMDNWEYRQTVLRQDEVSEFIHNTKGEKYSALLPLFGLQNMEIAADNFRQLEKTVSSEAKLIEKQINLACKLRRNGRVLSGPKAMRKLLRISKIFSDNIVKASRIRVIPFRVVTSLKSH